MAKLRPLDRYLDEVAHIRSLPGCKETSFYPAVSMLLNNVGADLKPKVYCLHHPSGGDGIPDFGLFEQTGFRRGESPTWRAGILPDRGAVDVKVAAHNLAPLRASQPARETH